MLQTSPAGASYFLLRGTPPSRRPSVSRVATPAAAASAIYLLSLLEHGRLITVPADMATGKLEDNVLAPATMTMPAR